MDKIIKALKTIKESFPGLRIINPEDKNGNSCIVVLGIHNAFTEAMLLASHPGWQDLYTSVESHGDGVSVSFTDPQSSAKQDGKGLLYIGKITETNLDELTVG